MADLKKIIRFYCRFTPSYSAIGYHVRRLLWRRPRRVFAGENWLVTGGSEGIGAAAARAGVEGGANVVCVARNAAKLQAFADSLGTPGRVTCETADFSLRDDVWALLTRIKGRKFDVVVDNVGIQKRDQILTREGLETSFVTNILSHYILVRELLARDQLTAKAAVIEVSSGGMYNHPLVVKDLNITGEGYLGVRAYGLSKRAQVVLTRYWRETFGQTGRDFYVMQPGWVDTASVGRSMPRFRAILRPVLRNHRQGADTIVWLASERPRQVQSEAIWFDRKARGVHIYAHTPKSTDTAADLVTLLDHYSPPPVLSAPAA
jgi:dehydrogenase/reductase SDR family protein 12